jgi:hypothetical protein
MSYFGDFNYVGKTTNKRKSALDELSQRTKLFCLEQGIGATAHSQTETVEQIPRSPIDPPATTATAFNTTSEDDMNVDDEPEHNVIDDDSGDDSYHGASDNEDFFADEETQVNWEQFGDEPQLAFMEDDEDDDNEDQDSTPIADAVATDNGMPDQ